MNQKEIMRLKHDPEIHWMPAWKQVTQERKPVCSSGVLSLFGIDVYDHSYAYRLIYNEGEFILPDLFNDQYTHRALTSYNRVSVDEFLCGKGIHTWPASHLGFTIGNIMKIPVAIPIEYTFTWDSRVGNYQHQDWKSRSACCWVLEGEWS